jgi:hypothetical protein
LCLHIATMELRQRMYVVVFESDRLILLFVAFVELLGTVDASFIFMEIILLFMLTCKNLLVKSPLGGRFEKPII